MFRLFLLFILFLTTSHLVKTQNIKSPHDYLGYELGRRFTYHHLIVSYFRHIDANSDKVQIVQYGTTYENRPLIAAIVTSAANQMNIEQLRLNNLITAGLREGKTEGEQLPIVWLSYNIHGNEASGSEAALKTLHYLVSSNKEEVNNWLDSLIIIIDPCLNPDGREKYAVWFHQAAGQNIITDMASWEHREPWPGFRTNHYLFDLNRDWLWQTQTESRQRIVFYQQWMPHVHIDFHEMGFENPYFFPPVAKPMHEALTEWQVEFQKILGSQLSKVFDKKKELYFTGEIFDLFSPAFGDTWPTFNGALGYTFEQGGGGSAGLAVINSAGDTITLRDRITNHFSSTIGTLETVFKNRNRILTEFNKYFNPASHKRVSSDFQSYIIKANKNLGNIADLLNLLDRNQISYYYPAKSNRRIHGFDFFTRTEVSYQLNQNNIIIPVNQAFSQMVQVLFEPKTVFSDTISFDLTAWALPYIFNVPTLAVKEAIPVNKSIRPKIKTITNSIPASRPFAYITEWNNFNSIKFLSSLLQEKIKVRFAQSPFEIGGRKFPEGSLVINLGENRYLNSNIDSLLVSLANKSNIELFATSTGRVEKGKDLGSSDYRLISPMKIAIIKGNGIVPSAIGELWFYFDREINFPASLINIDHIANLDLLDYDLIIMPSGSYSKAVMDVLLSFVRKGGRLIALERSLLAFERDTTLVFGKTVSDFRKNRLKELQAGKNHPDSLLVRFEDRRKRALQNVSASSIYKLTLDRTHPFSFGIGNELFIMKRNSNVFPYLPEKAYNIGYFRTNAHKSGFVGKKLKNDLENSLGIGQEILGEGNIIYITDSPVFRAIFTDGKFLLGNMIFLGSSLSLSERYLE